MNKQGVLPLLISPKDAASFSHSVLPFYSSALRYFSSLHHGTWDIYSTTNPFVFGTGFSIASSLTVFILSQITGNWSWVDRLWSLLPVYYGFHYIAFAAQHDLVSPRLVLLTGLQLVWGVRLTYNYWRKGGYSRGSEDYRWIYVRDLIVSYFPASFSSAILVSFNLVFVSVIQNILLFLLTAPNYLVLLVDSQTPLNYQDALCTIAVLSCVAIESVADEQQWIYQRAKHSTPSSSTRSHSRTHPTASYCEPKDLKRGFIAGGLWRYSRHPNFGCEQAIWCLFYSFGCIATRTPYNWTVVGPLLLVTVIFAGSTILTEWITAKKYPAYKLYQKRVAKFIPWPGYFWRDEDDDNISKQT